ncbi:TetR/AcrR family transcriptional regulator [Dactylosporangium sp. CA-139066]|uniref:TetR/AcrR family transcriptional regulator n=1 Tax=Dactylosporangium sp. CA-139066 TaxID=3239930 RepID=UPI003D8C88EB
MAGVASVGAKRGENYGGQSRQERAAGRRDRLVAAAVQLFAARSYDDVTVSDVCALARVSKRYFYDHFTDREALLLSVHREVNDWLLAGLAAAAPRDPAGVEELLRPMLGALVRLLAEHPQRARVIYINAPRMELRRRGVLRHDADVVARLVGPVVGPPRDPVRYERTLLTLVAGITQVVIDWVWRDMTDPPEPLVDHLTTLATAILLSLGPADGAPPER